jgi:hypothetical protein
MGVHWNMDLDLITRISATAAAWSEPFFVEYTILGAWNIWKQRNKKHFEHKDVSIVSWLAQFTSDLDLLRVRVKPVLRNNIDSFIRELRV